MKCPKCQYIGFDNGERCRNCGYEFSLSVDVAALDLPIQTGDEPEGPLADLALADLDHALTEPPPPPAPPEPAPRQTGGAGRLHAADRLAAAAPRRHSGSSELPLFRDRVPDDDAPLVAPPAVPRAPLAVRRATPTIPKTQPRDQPADPDLDAGDLPRPITPAARHAGGAARAARRSGAAEPAPHAAAGAGARLLAAGIDAIILGSITLAVLHFTLQLTRLGFADLDLLPKVPLLTFLVLLNGGYFVTFTAAGGQTIGKMAMGIRVVPADPEGRALARVPLAHALLRVAGYAVSLLPAGLGYLPALVGQDRRAIHDRLADTRVVKS